mmetsp:Transcript_5496/g.14905  ORF Transcript_5496/g.14905 Transcript_5496/m.14905 type:complete len:225 (-) Transcript_5496:323-997(-)
MRTAHVRLLLGFHAAGVALGILGRPARVDVELGVLADTSCGLLPASTGSTMTPRFRFPELTDKHREKDPHEPKDQTEDALPWQRGILLDDQFLPTLSHVALHLVDVGTHTSPGLGQTEFAHVEHVMRAIFFLDFLDVVGDGREVTVRHFVLRASFVLGVQTGRRLFDFEGVGAVVAIFVGSLVAALLLLGGLPSTNRVEPGSVKLYEFPAFVDKHGLGTDELTA